MKSKILKFLGRQAERRWGDSGAASLDMVKFAERLAQLHPDVNFAAMKPADFISFCQRHEGELFDPPGRAP